MEWRRFLFFNAAGGIVWATIYGVVYYVFGGALSKLSTTIDVALGDRLGSAPHRLRGLDEA